MDIPGRSDPNRLSLQNTALDVAHQALGAVTSQSGLDLTEKLKDLLAWLKNKGISPTMI